MSDLNHCSFLLRLWREDSDAPWRVTLIPTKQPNTHQHFESLEACYAFVQTQITPVTACQPLQARELPR